MPKLSTSPIIVLGAISSALLLYPIRLVELRLALALIAAGTLGILAAYLILPKLDPEHRWDALEVALLATCLAAGIAVLLTGIVTALPGPITAVVLASATLLTIAPLSLAAARHGVLGRTILPRTIAHAVLLIAVAAPLRFIDLGYSEFQGDEASILHRASAITQDINVALLAHRKGPGEILVATYFGDLVGRVTESDTRTPFALLSVLSVLAVYAAGRAMFNPSAGLIAGLLWAINGYSVGFGRIVQYHSITVLLCAMALVCAWKAESSSSRWALRRASMALLALSLMFGFNVIVLGLPAVFVMATSGAPNWRVVGRRLVRRRKPRLTDLLVGIAASAVVVYVTLEWRDMWRVLSFRLGHGQPFNNLDVFGSVSVRYLGQPYLLLVVAASVAVAVWLASRSRSSRWQAWLAAVVLAGLVIGLIALHGEPTWLAIVVWLALTLACLLAPAVDRPFKLLGVAALVPLGLYGFVLEQTGTHWYEAFPPMLLLVGALGVRLAHTFNRRALMASSAVGAVILVILGAYPVYTFVPLWPRDVPMPLAGLYRPTWRATREGGTFGFPHQDGLKAISLLQNAGAMPMPYESNASPEVTRWYLPSAERCDRPRGSYITLFSERQPTKPPAGRTIWVILVRGQPQSLVRDQTATPRNIAQLSVEAPTGWFDENLAHLERPLTVQRNLCSQTMSPAWRRN